MKKLLLSLMIAATCFSGEMAWGKDNSATVSAYKKDFPEYIKFYAKYCTGIVDATILALENMKKYDKDNKKIIENDIDILKKYKKALECIHNRDKESSITSNINKCPRGSLKIFSANVSDEHESYYLNPIKKSFRAIPEILFNKTGASSLGDATNQFLKDLKLLIPSK